MNAHANKLLEDCLEAAYRDHARLIISKAMEDYLVERHDNFRRMHAGLQKLYEAHALLSKEIKNNI
jgi:hypothetical protein